MLNNELIKKIEAFVYSKPRSIQEVASHIGKNWRTADRYVQDIENNFGTILANTANIGAGGLLVHLNQKLAIEVKVEVRIEFSKAEIFQCFGRVLRCHEDQSSGEKTFYAIAIAFEGLDEAKIAYLKGRIDKLLI